MSFPYEKYNLESEIFNRNRLGHALSVNDRLPLRRGRLYTHIGPEKHTVIERLSISYKISNPIEPIDCTIGYKIKGEVPFQCTIGYKIRGFDLINRDISRQCTIGYKIKGERVSVHHIAYKLKLIEQIQRLSIGFKIKNVLTEYNTIGYKIRGLDEIYRQTSVRGTIGYKIKGEVPFPCTIGYKILGEKYTEHTIGYKISNPIDDVHNTIGFKIKNVYEALCTLAYKIVRPSKIITDAFILTEDEYNNMIHQSLFGESIEGTIAVGGETLSLFYGTPEVWSIETTPTQYIEDVDYTWDDTTHIINRIDIGGIGIDEEVMIKYGNNLEYNESIILNDLNHTPRIGTPIVKNMTETITYTEDVDYVWDPEYFKISRLDSGSINRIQTVKIFYGVEIEWVDKAIIDPDYRLNFAPNIQNVAIYTDKGYFLIKDLHYIFNAETTNIIFLNRSEIFND